MSVDPFAVFKTHEDYVSWDRYEEQAELLEGLTNEEKQSLKSGIRDLRGLLGEQFLRHSVEEGNPVFFWLFRNAVPHAKRSLMRLADELRAFEQVDGFRGLVVRLKNATKAAEALTVLAAASRFRDVGFIVSFDPKLNESPKVPDLRLLDFSTGQEIYVEVSRLMQGGEHELHTRIYRAIVTHVLDAIWTSPGVDDITKPRVQPYVRILGSISLAKLPEVIRQIRETIYKTATDNEYREQKIGSVIEMAVSPANDHSKAKAWAAARGVSDLVEGPPIILDNELRRARDKVSKELQQLPPDKPGIIAIPIESMLFMAFHPYDILIEIAEEAKHHSNLLCIALFHSIIEGPQKSSISTLGDHAFVTKMNEISTERTAFVMNENFSLPIPTSTIEKVRNAFLKI